MRISTELVGAARAGDVKALDAILRHSRQDLRRYAEFHCEINDVEDAVQETLLTVSKRLRDLRQVESLASWLFRIVKRECNRMRRGWRMLTNQDIDERLMPVTLPGPMELRADISLIMAALPPHYREILLMRDVDGLTLQEIAEQLELGLAAVKSRLHRARALARERLSDRAR
jgi:RNA polymerase sigma factor (sigma-70 family)